MSAILLKEAQKHTGLKAVGMAERWLITKEINDKLEDREEVHRNDDIHNEANKSVNEEESRLMTELTREILWQRNVCDEMWRVLKSLTDNKPDQQ